jgi:hypothetical protein
MTGLEILWNWEAWPPGTVPIVVTAMTFAYAFLWANAGPHGRGWERAGDAVAALLAMLVAILISGAAWLFWLLWMIKFH